MGRADKLFRVSPFNAFKAGIKTIRLLVKRAAFRRDGAFTAFQIPFPMRLTFLMNCYRFTPF